MSFIDLPAYFRSQMAVVSSDLKEWEDGFNIENIPSTIIDRSWHISYGPFTYTGTAHTCLGFSCPVNLSVFLKGYKYPKEAVDTALVLSDAIVRQCTNPAQRLTQAKIKNVLPGRVDIRPLAQSNDNAVILDILFNCSVFIS